MGTGLDYNIISILEIMEVFREASFLLGKISHPGLIQVDIGTSLSPHASWASSIKVVPEASLWEDWSAGDVGLRGLNWWGDREVCSYTYWRGASVGHESADGKDGEG